MGAGRLSALIVIVAAAAGCGAPGAQIPRAQVQDPAEAMFNGYVKPEVKCFACHNGDGRGAGDGPALAPRVRRLGDDKLRARIRDGHDDMPGYRGRMTDAEIDQMAVWLRGRYGGPTS